LQRGLSSRSRTKRGKVLGRAYQGGRGKGTSLSRQNCHTASDLFLGGTVNLTSEIVFLKKTKIRFPEIIYYFISLNDTDQALLLFLFFLFF
jgi:hypothetical protein